MKQVVAALIVREDEILICQRTKYQPMALQWEFPGGKIEQGEESVAALVRELEEELGITPTVGTEVARIQHNYKNGAAIDLRFYLVETFEGELDNRIFRDIRWVKREALPHYDFLEADKGLVADIASGKLL
ncbi:MAG TPA: (deoxy)nucleoside triphosphate pyrophosphohydrolase [Clostridia bacterium]|nr:(deoxy)nucleoside triphosphate pyrophosphohydrolase [Clostridia bacterium]